MLAAISANAFGAALGAIIGGPLCDRYGRKFIYTYDLVLYMVGVLMAVFAQNVIMLGAAFVLTGIAVGAGVPASWTYIAEEAPAEGRAKHVGMAQLAWSLGPVIGFLLAVILGPLGLLGSRIIFAHLFVVAAIVWYIRQGLHESVMWKDDCEQLAASTTPRRGIRELLSNRLDLKSLLSFSASTDSGGICAGQMGIFMPRVYASAGVANPVHQNLLQVLLWSCTVAATWFGFMKFGDRVSRRVLYVTGAALGIGAWVLLVFAQVTLPVLILFAVAWGISAGVGAQAFYSVWASELFPTPYRASAQGILFFSARLAIGVLSYFFPTLLAASGVPAVGAIMLTLLTLALLVGAIWAPRTQGRSLREIEVERYGPTSRSARAEVG